MSRIRRPGSLGSSAASGLRLDLPGQGAATGPRQPLESGDGRDLRGSAPLVRASWIRSRTTFPDPGTARVLSILDRDQLAHRQATHPLASVLPLIRSLLGQPARDHGLIMAIGDELGQLLWVEGDSRTRSTAEAMAFQAGADWSEQSMGTSAPAIALLEGVPAQVRREEHFSPLAVAFSCSAVPLTDPLTGERIGFLDLTGDDRAADSLILPYLRATASAVEAHLLTLPRAGSTPDASPTPHASTLSSNRPPLGASAAPRGPTPPHAAGDAAVADAAAARPDACPVTLHITGSQPPTLHTPQGETRLSLRHAEILAVLARSGAGLESGELAAQIYPGQAPGVTVRAEVARLRRALTAAGAAPLLTLDSQPYRLVGLNVDALGVAGLLDRGAHREALAGYRGALLPASEAPAIVAWRQELAATLREAVLADASVETLLDYLARPEAADDEEAWAAALRLLPARSPKRAAAVARLEALRAGLE